MKEEYKRNPDKSYNDTISVLKGRRVIIPSRYKNLLKQYIPAQAEILTNGRSVDVKFAEDGSIDYAIDIVVEGRKCKQLGIGIIAPVFRSDGVLIGNIEASKLFNDADVSFPSLDPCFFLWLNTGRTPRQKRARDYYGSIH